MPRSVSLPLSSLAGLLLLAACTSDPTNRVSVGIRDSAGVRIIENPGGVEVGIWHLTEAPTVQIGGLQVDPEQQVYDVRDAVRLSDGRTVVANNGTHELRFYDASGQFLKSAGREGEGPGEFRSTTSLLRAPADSLIVWDSRIGRLSVFDERGSFVRSFRLKQRGGIGPPRPIGRFADGDLLARSGGVSPHPESGVHRDTATLHRFGPEGAVDRTLGRHPYIEIFLDHDLGVFMARPFGRHTSFAVVGDGYVVATADRYEIQVHDWAGVLRRSIRKQEAPRRLTAREIEAYRRRRLASLPDEAGPAARQRMAKVLQAVPFPATVPPYGRVEVDRVGHLWVAEDSSPDPETGSDVDWTVFDPEGRIVATVRTPGGFYPFEIGRDYVLGRARDELDVEYVRIYELSRG